MKRLSVSGTILVMCVVSGLWQCTSPANAPSPGNRNTDSLYVKNHPDIGIAWTNLTSVNLFNSLNAIAWTGKQFVVVGNSGMVLTSPDGHTWTHQTTPVIENLNAVAFSSTMLVAVGDTGTIISSPDGISWTDHSVVKQPAFMGVCWTGKQFAAIGTCPVWTPLYRSPDGLTWNYNLLTRFGTDYYVNHDFTSMVWTGTMLVATRSSYYTEGIDVIADDTVCRETQSLSSDFHDKVSLAGKVLVAAGDWEFYTSADGYGWTTRGFTDGLTRIMHGATAVGPRLVVVGVGAAISDDGGATWTWNNMSQSSPGSVEMNAIAWSGTSLVAVGNGGAILTSP